jgi:regulatory protein
MGASGVTKVAVGGSSFIFQAAILAGLGLDPAGLRPGTELDEAGVEALGLAAAVRDAEKKALALLARAEQSRLLLSAKLEQRGCPARAARLAMDRLEAEGLLDDRRFAEAWLRSRSGNQALSPAKLMAGLRARGIAESTAKAAFAEVFGDDERIKLLKRAAERELAAADGDREAAGRALRKLGFKPGEIRELFS